MINIGILSPIPAVRAGLRALLDEHSGRAGEVFAVVYDTAFLDDLPRYAEELDVLLVAWENLPFSTLGEILAEIGERKPVLLISESGNEARSLARMGLHTWGVLPLESSADELAAAIYALQQGLIVGTQATLGSTFAERVLDQREELDDLVEALTERELQVLGLLGRGLANKQIAVSLGISEHTVKFHVSSIYAKLGVASRTEAVRAGVLRGLVEL